MGDDVYLNVSKTMSHSRANGPGVRAVIWVQGCTIGCPGCYNAFTHVHEQRTLATPGIIAEWVSSLDGIEGVSFSGGEPFEQAKAVRAVIVALREKNPDLTFFSFSGFTLAELRNSKNKEVLDLLSELDLLCAGPYIHKLRETNLLWRGSSNQKLHYLTKAYCEGQENEWVHSSPVEEFCFDGETIHFSGFQGQSSIFLRSLNHEFTILGS